MDFKNVLDKKPFVLSEGAILERLTRECNVAMDVNILNASLIYDVADRALLEKLYKQYIAVGERYKFPMINLTPTWRANKERILGAGLQHKDVNGDCFRFLAAIRASYGEYAKQMYIGGLIGCKGDAYKPEEALTSKAAYEFHKYQVAALASAGVDFLIAETLPAVSEALGIAQVMAEFGCEYIISFVIRPEGMILDGTTLGDAVAMLDSLVHPKPLGYMVNCVHASVLQKALEQSGNVFSLLQERLIGIQANTSAKSPKELDESAELQGEDPEIFADAMQKLHEKFGIKILGGCCGTNQRHIECLADKISRLGYY
ncbi:MAG TPA: homocysteine S-methyltransferase family protein [Negativicutes bacterium]